MDNEVQLFKSEIKPDSVLGLLKQSIESLHNLRIGKSHSPCRLKISFSAGYSLYEKSLNNPKEKPFATSSTFFTSPEKSFTRSRNPSLISRNTTPERRRCNYFRSNRVENSENLAKKLSFDRGENLNKSAKAENVKNEIKNLRNSQNLVQNKLNKMNESLSSLKSAHLEEQNALFFIMNNLEHVSSGQKAEDLEKIPAVVEKLSRLESSYSYLKSFRTEGLKNFKEEMKAVNYTLQDLKECGEILKELAICLGKEPISDYRAVRDENGSKDLCEETVKISKIEADELLRQKEMLLKEKEKMESEFRSIPENSKSMVNKRRRQTLELDLSVNYSKLLAINNKIRKFN